MPEASFNVQQFVDALIEDFVKSRFPAAAALQPELDSAVAATVALRRRL